MEELDLNKAHLLTESLLEGGLSEIVEAGFQVFGYPVIIIDNAFKIMAHSDKSHIRDSYWIENIKYGFCKYEFIMEVQKIESFREGRRKKEAFTMICPVDKMQKMVMPLVVHEKYAGYIIVLNNDSPAEQQELNLLEFMSKIVVTQFKKYTKDNDFGSFTFENMVMDILQEQIKEEAVLKNRLRSADFLIQLPAVMMVCDVSEYKRKKSRETVLKDMIDTCFGNPKQMIYEEYILILLEKRESKEFSPTFIQFLEEKNIRMTVSSAFDNLIDIRRHFTESVNTLEILRKLSVQGAIFYNDRCRMLRLIHAVEEKGSLLDYCDKSLLSMIAYDKKHETHYFETAKAYYGQDKNIVKAAQSLYIHRNTMMYRLDKMKELFGFETETSEDVLTALMTIKIFDYLRMKRKS